MDSIENKVTEYVQEGFGNVLASIGSAQNNYHLTAKQEPETGLYYFYARWYDMQVGRFITWDPILRRNLALGSGSIVELFISLFFRNTQDMHPYVYVQNNPLNLIDLYGLKKGKDKGKCPPDIPEACQQAAKNPSWENCAFCCAELGYVSGPYLKCIDACQKGKIPPLPGFDPALPHFPVPPFLLNPRLTIS